MKRNFFLYLLLFFFTLTTSVFEMAKDINFKQAIHHVKSAAIASAQAALEEKSKASYKFQDEDSPMILRLASMEWYFNHDKPLNNQ